MYDKKNNLLHMNPGAIGDYGIHKVKTILSFNIEGKEIKDLKVIEFPRIKSYRILSADFTNFSSFLIKKLAA